MASPCGGYPVAYSVLQSDDALVAGAGAGWPAPYNAATQDPDPFFATRMFTGVGINPYLVDIPLLTFDTSFITRLQSVVRAILRLEVADAVSPDDLRLNNDKFSWGTVAGPEHYDLADQPGADGQVPLSAIPPGVIGTVSLVCRPGHIVRGGLTQYRLTLSGATPVYQPTGINVLVMFSVAVRPSRLDLLVANHVGLWEM